MSRYFFTIIVYDVTDDKRRALIAKELENYGYRVQYSVFEALLERVEIERLTRSLRNILDSNEDSIRIYVLTRKSKKEIIKLGVQRDYNPGEDDVLVF